MKAYGIDLRERVVKFVNAGGTKTEAVKRFGVCRASVYRYLEAAKKGSLKAKTTWGSWRKLDPQALRTFLKKHPDATLCEMEKVFAIHFSAIWVCLKKLGLTLKKTHKISRKKRVGALVLPA